MNAWNQLDAPDMAAGLRAALARGLPGRGAQRAMAPELAYGRHGGPVPREARRAAVLLALNRTPDGWAIPAILRPVTMRAHAGQVSLPGGMREAGETAPEAALREFAEELGAATEGLEIVGALSPVFVFVSSFEVTPLVAIAHHPLALAPSPAEVAEVVWLPVARLVDPGCRGSHWIRRGELVFRAPHLAIGGREIWGATSLILAEFAALFGLPNGSEERDNGATSRESPPGNGSC
ncbi:MAG: CoA pyrophosphatase [Pirellulaceae bacterium]|nr:CoA pyrophosphatase [Pirellulaceae bacterium]